MIDAIPLIVYHSIDNEMTSSSTDNNLFALEMEYLHENSFEVIIMKDPRYDEMNDISI